MSAERQAIFLTAVEGSLDEAVAQRLIAGVGGSYGDDYGGKGKGYLLQRLRNYNQAARHSPWFVLMDLDTGVCAPALRRDHLSHQSQWMCFRIAIRAVEAWLIADQERLGKFLGVGVTRIPRDPEALEDPKRVVVDLARNSRRRDIREDMVPRSGSGRSVGRAYSSRLIEFVLDVGSGWRPTVAESHSDSLRRCAEGLRNMVARWSVR